MIFKSPLFRERFSYLRPSGHGHSAGGFERKAFSVVAPLLQNYLARDASLAPLLLWDSYTSISIKRQPKQLHLCFDELDAVVCHVLNCHWGGKREKGHCR